MKCKSHHPNQGPGVCATCLRERLVELQASRNEESQAIPSPDPSARRRFPRSVSPVSRSGDSSAAGRSDRRHRRSFFSTPQVGPAVSAGRAAGGDGGGFSLVSFLFGHRSSDGEGSGSWIRSLIRRRKKKPRLFPAAEENPPAAASTASCRTVGRGMSPAEESDGGSDSGYSTASSGAWRMPTPSPGRRAEAARRRQNGRGLPGFAVCLSPLVRASPGRRRSKAAAEAAAAFSGDLRTGTGLKPRNGLAPNRSKKLADMGRYR